MSANIILRELNGWAYASISTTVLTFLTTAFCVYKYRSSKASRVAASACISALALVITNAVLFASVYEDNVRFNVIFFLRGVHYSFAFFPIFYVCHRISEDSKIMVYIGYLWMLAVVSCSLAATILFGGNSIYYSNRVMNDTYNLLLLTVLSIWGFIAIALALYLMNKKHFISKARTTMLAFIGLTFIVAITVTVVLYTPIESEEVINGVSFFLEELAFKVAIIIAAYYGSAWIQVDSTENDGGKIETDGDLEANHEPITVQ